VFESRVLRRIFGPKREEEIGGCRTLRNVELHNLYPSPIIIRVMKSRRMRLAVDLEQMGKKNAYMILMGKLEGKRPLERPRLSWEVDIRTEKREKI
jgi:hypothetical protein